MRTVKSQMVVLSIVSISAALVISASSIIGMTSLSSLQSVVHGRSVDGMQAKKAASMGAELYQIIADTIINRNFQEAAKEWNAAKIETQTALDLSAKMADTPEETKSVEQAKTAFGEVSDIYEKKLVPLLKAEGDTTAQVKTIDDEIDARVTLMKSSLNFIEESMEREASAAAKTFSTTFRNTLIRNIVLATVAIIAMTFLAVIIMRGLFRQLGGEPALAAKVAETIASGDLSGRIDLREGDTTSLMFSIKRMQTSLAAMMGEIQAVSGVVSKSASDLTRSSHQILQRSQQQNDAASSMSAAVEEMTVSIGMVADSAEESNNMSTRADETAGTAHQQVDAVTREIQSIVSDIANTSAIMKTLGEQSGHIGNIVDVIRDIAGQTNLLALNAAIEAARAGEQGRGFAVVADEVRKLAERTESSTAEITEMVSSIQASVGKAQQEMEANRTQVEKGAALATSAGASMTEVRSNAQGMIVIISDIANALKEQKSASNQIAVNVERIARMAEENDDAAKQIADGTSDLEASANSLTNMIGKFKTN